MYDDHRKTHTMIGPPDNRGVNMRSFETIFANANDEYRETGTQTVVNMSMLQVYNERIIDLLVNKPQSHMEPSNLDSLHIRQRQGGEVYVEGLTEYVVKNEKEVSTLLSLGGSNLMVASNNINEYSSRSHLVIDVKIQRTNPQTRQNTIGHLHLIDLAGSERVKTTEATGSRLREAQYINKLVIRLLYGSINTVEFYSFFLFYVQIIVCSQ